MAEKQNISIKAYQDKGRVVATDFTEDRDGEKIDPKGVSLKNYKKNPVLLWGHDHRQLPVGTAKSIRVEGEQITFEPAFHDHTEEAKAIGKLWENDILKAVSIGFIPQEREGNVWTKSELLEISVVNVPSNPKALAEAKAKGIDVSALEKKVTDTELQPAPEGRGWDADAAKVRVRKWAGGPDNIDWNKYKQAFAWYDSNDKEKITAYKLPIADVVNGELKAIWRGVATAMAAMLGARGGVDIPENERRKVYSLLKNYYEKFNKEAPEFRLFEGEQDIYESYEKGHILAEDAMAWLDSNRRKSEQSQTAEVEVDDQPSDEEKVRDALKLFAQTVNTQSKDILTQLKKL